MIDSSVLRKRTLSLPPPKSDASTDDNALFVSEDYNDAQPSNVLTNGHVSDNTPFGSPSDSASSLHNAVESSKPPSIEPSVSDGLMDPSRGPSRTQPSESPKTFSSLFSGNAPKPNPFGAPTTTSPNPFGALSSPFAPVKPDEGQKGNSVFSTAPAAQPSLFPTPNPFKSTDRKDEAAAPAPTTAPTTPQFKLPNFSEATASSAPTFSAPAEAPSFTPQFKSPSFPQATTSPAPAFGSPAPAPETAGSNKSTNSTAGQPASSIFDSVKPPAFSTGTTLFNFSSPSTAPKEPEVKAPVVEPANPQQPPFPSIPSSTSSERFPPKQKGKSSKIMLLSVLMVLKTLRLSSPPPRLQPLPQAPLSRI